MTVEGSAMPIEGLEGRRVLIVEDEYFIAADLKRAFQEAGALARPVASVAEALALLAEPGIDAATLDVNLDGTASFPIADALTARAIPFLFLTGYDDWSLPERYRNVPQLTKPCPVEDALALLAQLLRESVAR